MNPVTIRTSREIAGAIQDFSKADWTRLHKVAAVYACNRPIEPDDLLQEAFRRALDGQRNCPAHVDSVRFLAEAMRSIADGELQKGKDGPRLIPIANHGSAETTVDPHDPAPGPEQCADSAEEAVAMKAALLALFGDDEIAQIILEGMMEGIEGEELRELTDLDNSPYQSKRRLIRRRIGKKFPEGWTS